MPSKAQTVSIFRWKGSQHPSMMAIVAQMKEDGLRPYMWSNMPNHRYAVRSHNYDKVLYVIDGTVEVTLPDNNQRVTLKGGDRIDIPAGVRHGTIVGRKGAKCVEASKRGARRR
ncbi:MAG: cupin domain-containing protein [Chloroflexota bacterium]